MEGTQSIAVIEYNHISKMLDWNQINEKTNKQFINQGFTTDFFPFGKLNTEEN